MAARTNMSATRVKPDVEQLLTFHVRRSERISPNFVRITLGGGDIDRFTPMGFDQWFRLFIPVSETSLSRLPNKLDTFAYLRYLAISKTERPVLRNYTVRAHRTDGVDGAEFDIDFVLHGSAAAGTSGPAASWAETCAVGDAVAILDEGIAYNPPAAAGRRTVLVADETGLPAAAGILESLPRDAVGTAVIEIPDAADAQDIDAPEGVELIWVPRADVHAVPGVAALARAIALPVTTEPFYGWAVGEQALPVAMRRHWVQAGVPKEHIAFTGYWKAGKH
jgi:NADPH-dependent ferric siderophore reductase